MSERSASPVQPWGRKFVAKADFRGECPVCLEPFAGRECRVLSCAHEFCDKCLENQAAAGVAGEGLQCGVCRCPFGRASDSGDSSDTSDTEWRPDTSTPRAEPPTRAPAATTSLRASPRTPTELLRLAWISGARLEVTVRVTDALSGMPPGESTTFTLGDKETMEALLADSEAPDLQSQICDRANLINRILGKRSAEASRQRQKERRASRELVDGMRTLNI